MSFFAELKRRNVFRVGIAYLVVSWLVLQVADVVLNNIEAPDWLFQAIMLVLGLGFPIVLIFAWAFEMTPDGIKKEKDVDRSQSITKQTGRKLDFTIIGVLVLVAAYFIWESRFQIDPATQATADADTSNIESGTASEGTMGAANKTNSIAVLPFANRSRSEDDEFFSDGIHDDLLTQLAKISDLKVISRTSVMRYKTTQKTIPEIAAELGVSTILEGGIQRAGKRIRINAQLIDVNTDEHLWAETFDREMTVENIFDIQSEITRQIVNAVRGELTTEEANVLAQIPTHSLDAYEAYLHARTLLGDPDYSRQKFERTEPWLEKAVELDPEFAMAWALLVRTHAQAIWMGYDDTIERLQKVRDALSKATEFGPFLPETLAARAEYLYRIENNYHEAEIAFRAASQAKPGDASLVKHLAFTQRRTGKWQQAVSNFQLAFELDTEEVDARSEMISTLLTMRAFDRAEPLVNSWIEKYPDAMDIKGHKLWLMVLRDGDLAGAKNLFNQIKPNGGTPYYVAATELPFLERDYQAIFDLYQNSRFLVFDDFPTSEAFQLQNKSRAYAHMGEAKQADIIVQQAVESMTRQQSTSSGSDSSNANFLDFLAYNLAQTGALAEALEAANQASELIPESRDSLIGYRASATRAYVLAKAGHRDEALLEIERLLSIPGYLNRWLLYLHPDWDFFRDDERFNELVRPLNLKEGP
jgi:TolB-like protein/Flp pilus assembly protein TadD